MFLLSRCEGAGRDHEPARVGSICMSCRDSDVVVQELGREIGAVRPHQRVTLGMDLERSKMSASAWGTTFARRSGLGGRGSKAPRYSPLSAVAGSTIVARAAGT